MQRAARALHEANAARGALKNDLRLLISVRKCGLRVSRAQSEGGEGAVHAGCDGDG